MVDFLGHRHVHIDHVEACKGCKTCVRACPNQAIRYIYAPPPREARRRHEDKSVEVRS
jgi:ferredoxin